MEWTRDEFADAVTRHSRRMYRAARSVLDSGADAEDAVSQAILQAWQSLDKLRDREAVGPWLVPLDGLAPEPAAPEPVRYDGLWEAVCALPPERRAAVVLFYYEEMPVGQIAKCLGVPAGTVKSRLARARKQLKELLQGQEGGYGTI